MDKTNKKERNIYNQDVIKDSQELDGYKPHYKYKNILTEIIKDKETWRQLKAELSKYNIPSSDTAKKDTRAGKIFEVFTKYYFLVSPTEKDNYKQVWLFEETPLEIRDKLNLGNQDYGVDLVLQDVEDQFFVVQCKYKNDEVSKLNWSADKIANLFAFCPKADGYIVFSNAVDLDHVSKTRHDNFTFYGVENLNEIDRDTFVSIYSLLTKNHFTERKLFDPLPHQQTAIQKCTQHFMEDNESRGQLILPCGAGKTFTALWIKEKIKSKNTLVLVPSLALLRQIKNEWSKQRRSVYQYLCVCSEIDIDKNTTDNLVTHTYEIDTRVTTNASRVKSFLSRSFDEKVIFSTYHSLPVAADAIKELNFEFDFTFCDEAHKTAGVGNNRFTLVHNNDLVPSKYRLYATATPRIVKETLKKKLGSDLKYTCDMDDPNIFGHEFHRMTFKDAIEQNILVDYKIIAIGVNSDELNDYIKERKFIDKELSIDELANNYALEHVMDRYDVSHGLTFHSRVKLAQNFADRHARLSTSVNTFSVSGKQSTSYRNLMLEEFKNSEKAIVSNARCLTEGVDVPVIDLVYFCDPKNSKIDIVQAAGRALRKSEGKEIGLIVVPIYHSNEDEVENSIGKSSFKNLVQVIRSLSDQDERLHEEINYIASGKGKHKSGKIDMVSSSFMGEKGKIMLEGFEKKLEDSLFDQIIEKSSNSWDLRYLDLKHYLEINKYYPSKKDNQELHSFISQQRTRKRNGALDNEKIRKLNAINFVWDPREEKWERLFIMFQAYSIENAFPPCKGIDDKELVKWYNKQQLHIRNSRTIESERLRRFLAIDNQFEGPANRKTWIEPYEKLVEFRLENPNRWPQYDRSDNKSSESKLNVFCQIIRRRHNGGKLENYWFEKMSSIDFNFDGKTGIWTQHYEKIRALLKNRNSVSSKQIGHKAYSWIIRHRKKYDEGKLSAYQAKKVEELDLERFFETWDEKFKKVKEWVEKNGKIPTKVTQKDFNSWLASQRARFNSNKLTEDQIQLLRSIGYDLEPKGNDKRQKKWLRMFKDVKIFKEKNGIWPKLSATGFEKQMYLWCQAQRAVQAGTAKNRKPLKKWQVEKLDSIGFYWAKSDSNDEQWEEKFDDFKKYVDSEGNFSIPTIINGKHNRLYRWFFNQTIAFKEDKLREDRLKKFHEIGFDFNDFENKANDTGYTKWANRVKEIADFIQKNGHYPKAGKDRHQTNLYGSLARTKSLKKNNQLSDQRLKLLSDLNIKLD